jgi:YebC/PmpR family DNA-binding regulatory protein
MSGHSKWSTIKRQKQSADIKRGKIFSKLARALTVAARAGTDPETNPKLRMAIEAAKAANMPKEKIKRAIDKPGAGGGDLVELKLEGYGPEGIAILIEAVSDNRQRTLAEIKHILDKRGGKLGEPGSVEHLFRQQGLITVDVDEGSRDEVMLAAIDAGAIEVLRSGEGVLVTTEASELNKVREALLGLGYQVGETKLSFEPIATVPVANAHVARTVLALMEELAEQEDVQEVYANFDIADELI